MTSKQLRGLELLANAEHNHGTAYSPDERQTLGLRGLLPPAICSMATHQERALANIRRKDCDIERYVFMQSLMGRNQNLFYRLLIDHVEELMPIVYTPTVGQACREFAHIFRQSRGFYITPQDRGEIREILDNWPEHDVRIIVVTDGERILGLGDLGANGMGIPIGKLALYTACAGISPKQCMPVMLDVGTNNESLRDDPLYLGITEPRSTGAAYDELVNEFVGAVQDKFPRALIQFEDFLTPNAYRLLHTYREDVLCFNDDIQGTAAVALAGLFAASRLSQQDFAELTVMFLGAGSAATGIADLLKIAFMEHGLTEQQALARIWFVDINGLVVSGRDDLLSHNLPYAHNHPPCPFLEAIESVRPNVLIGATGAAQTFNQRVIRSMANINRSPIIFALSNPTSQAECTAEQAYQWSDGRAIFASGSPFAPVQYGDRWLNPGQGNNAYIFPGVGLGALVAQARVVSDEMFLVGAKTLAQAVRPEELERGAVYPSLKRIREVSMSIAEAVANCAFDSGLAQVERPVSLRADIQAAMYEPGY